MIKNKIIVLIAFVLLMMGALGCGHEIASHSENNDSTITNNTKIEKNSSKYNIKMTYHVDSEGRTIKLFPSKDLMEVYFENLGDKVIFIRLENDAPTILDKGRSVEFTFENKVEPVIIEIYTEEGTSSYKIYIKGAGVSIL